MGGPAITTTQINLDDLSLAEAADVLGAKTTVNSALRAVVRQHRQRQMLERAAHDGTYSDAPWVTPHGGDGLPRRQVRSGSTSIRQR